MGTAVLAVGEISEHEREPLQRAAARAEGTISFQPSIANALGRLRSASCVLIDSASEVAELVDHVRDDVALFTLPVIVLAESPTPEIWQRAYAQGADDVVLKRDAGAITRRLLNVTRTRSAERPEAKLGHAIVASNEDTSRRRVGRTLRNVGFDVAYAASVAEATQLGEHPAFVVTTERAPAGTDGSVAYVNGVPVLFLGEQAAFTHVEDRIADATARVLFFADEQALAGFKDRRVSQRKQCGVLCSFREAGSLEPSYGMTHNVSREGFYVRTLDPPKPTTALWLEVTAPGTSTPVHLRAQAIWQRLPGAKFGVVPPGFGLHIEAERCPPGDLAAFVAAYEALRAR
jgi:CheY-like chemotaxis protein